VPWLGRQHMTKPAMSWRASHDDADQDLTDSSP